VPAEEANVTDVPGDALAADSMRVPAVVGGSHTDPAGSNEIAAADGTGPSEVDAAGRADQVEVDAPRTDLTCPARVPEVERDAECRQAEVEAPGDADAPDFGRVSCDVRTPAAELTSGLSDEGRHPSGAQAAKSICATEVDADARTASVEVHASDCTKAASPSAPVIVGDSHTDEAGFSGIEAAGGNGDLALSRAGTLAHEAPEVTRVMERSVVSDLKEAAALGVVADAPEDAESVPAEEANVADIPSDALATNSMRAPAIVGDSHTDQEGSSGIEAAGGNGAPEVDADGRADQAEVHVMREVDGGCLKGAPEAERDGQGREADASSQAEAGLAMAPSDSEDHARPTETSRSSLLKRPHPHPLSTKPNMEFSSGYRVLKKRPAGCRELRPSVGGDPEHFLLEEAALVKICGSPSQREKHGGVKELDPDLSASALSPASTGSQRKRGRPAKVTDVRGQSSSGTQRKRYSSPPAVAERASAKKQRAGGSVTGKSVVPKPSKALTELMALGSRARQRYLSKLSEAKQVKLAMELSMVEAA